MRERLLAAEKIKAIEWRDGTLHLLDQRLLPQEERWLSYDSASGVAGAIRDMVVRGAPAIGISAAYGVLLGARRRLAAGGDWRAALEEDFRVLAESRPTAVNLFWALDRMRERLARLKDGEDALVALEAEAVGIHESDREANLTMAQLGLELIRKHSGSPQALLTHCNTGALATGGFGTALGVIRAAWLEGLVDRVYADETRPWLQGARLTAWELAEEGIPVSLNADGAAAHLMKTKGITWVIVGADRITAEGDVANKIGTYQLAVVAMHHGVRFMVVAPSSTIDMSLHSGEDIPIEERDGRELLEIGGKRVAASVEAVNPVFDVTPADLIDAIVTERGVVERPNAAKMAELMSRKRLH
ncbi:methylthioribose-1-phosphate isomerase [Azotobacter vinelandii CA]|uniref:Methylthioribose-1-phosphate isomerase n=2 Tax=Azotobacter vinelandii TaxID=354 RepID=MTNA_AZOVD|nr:S-methyl-5-thioribose-1-phosphate isomerase [Azotobacter vinelandii]C1DRQ7.1 RecName: Full=Methylthioribose-1-phosphate isomerase; Short=M1Pi; Short=MTR-1-P isomerase; AltName: Full=S-methyl-5-thioribose-1-phosphate isomerase [Azotobacter vinelandii DJ]ACO77795.1 Initiation factor 2B [Azotobacter vinelandii DJ]AGK12983.1 methylthioribose-1-phosphate isomerase [Azotobacter vinelandii CA]AGK18336.1 methylthioribose-1-phosphate isomerase [Azotobacter vinelandii CA6]SFX87259.1 methylthioribose-